MRWLDTQLTVISGMTWFSYPWVWQTTRLCGSHAQCVILLEMHMVMAMYQELRLLGILRGCIGMALHWELEIVSAMVWTARWLDAKERWLHWESNSHLHISREGKWYSSIAQVMTRASRVGDLYPLRPRDDLMVIVMALRVETWRSVVGMINAITSRTDDAS